jgi:glycosyltransferase involved in cell wall biosynthesis
MASVPILTVQPHNSLGGPSVQHISFLKAISSSRFAVHVLIAEGHAMERQYAKVADSVLTMPRMPTFPRSKSPIVLARYAAQTATMATQVARAAKQVDARIIYLVAEAFPAPLFAAQRLCLPSVVHILGMSIFQPLWVGRSWSRFVLNRATRIIACQQLIADLVRRTGVDSQKVRVVYNCIDPQAIRDRAEAEPLDLNGDGLKVGMVAGMDRRKGHMAFLEAAARVARQLPDVTFYCIGDTSGNDAYLGELEAKIDESALSGRCHLVGRVSNAAAWMQAMDVYCIPSLSEALSVAGLEAMALAKPIVATNVGGNPEGVADGENGLICAPADPDDLAARLLTLLRDEGLRTEFGRRGRERVAELFSVERNAALLHSVFEELLPEGANGPFRRQPCTTSISYPSQRLRKQRNAFSCCRQ